MNKAIKSIVIAGTGSGVGKTSITLGIIAALTRRGLKVQPFKVGPDFLDPMYHSLAAGRECYNLDGWMTDKGYIQQLFSEVTADADIAVIEGVMGMFDGASVDSLSGSTAEIASWLGAPVILIGDAGGAARSFAATVKGFHEFEKEISLSGIIANQVGSQNHTKLLDDALKVAHLPPMVGGIPKKSLPSLKSRHLGLLSADRKVFSETQSDLLADACEEFLNFDIMLRLGTTTKEPATVVTKSLPKSVRIAVARDEAFHFSYPDNLKALENAGAELLFFSPLLDSMLPDSIQGLYIPGGYPEEFAVELAKNCAMRQAISEFVAKGGVVYGECGGLMYLGRSLENRDGDQFAMCGVIPIDTRMLERRKMLGYAEVELAVDCHFGSAGSTIRGHEFHYSEITTENLELEGWQKNYKITRRRSKKTDLEGFYRDNVLGSYVHLHWASKPEASTAFINKCERAVLL